MNRPKVAIVGLGRWGRILLENFVNFSDVVTCFSRDNKSTEWLKENYPNLEISSSYESILERRDIDIVVIATPIDTHFKLAKKALESKKHVFLEKPPCTDYNEITSLISLADENNVRLFVDRIFLFHPVYLQLKELLQKEDIVSFNFSWCKFGSFNEDIYWNLVFHDFYITNDLIGRINSSRIISKEGIISTTDITTMSINAGDNVSGMIYINRFMNTKDKSITINTKQNTYLWQNDSLFKLDEEEKLQLVFKSEEKPLGLMIQEFISQIYEVDSSNTESSGKVTVRDIENLTR